MPTHMRMPVVMPMAMPMALAMVVTMPLLVLMSVGAAAGRSRFGMFMSFHGIGL